MRLQAPVPTPVLKPVVIEGARLRLRQSTPRVAQAQPEFDHHRRSRIERSLVGDQRHPARCRVPLDRRKQWKAAPRAGTAGATCTG